MRSVFLLVYGNDCGTREQVKGVVDNSPYISTWRYDLPNCFYLVSEHSAREIADDLRKSFPNGTFIVSKADVDYWGWAKEATWYLFEKKWTKPEV